MLGQARHHIEALHSLASLTFQEVVDRAHHDHLAGALINRHRQHGAVGLAHPFGGGVGAHGQHLNAGVIAVGHLINGGEIFRGETGVPQPPVHGGEQAAHHRHQVGRELQLDRTTGGPACQQFDLRGVAMAHHAIGADRFSSFRKQQVLFGRPATTGGAGFGINDDALTFNQPLLQQGHQGQQAGGGETAGGTHQLGLSKSITSPLHQAINSLLAEGIVLALLRGGFLAVGRRPLAEAGEAVIR